MGVSRQQAHAYSTSLTEIVSHQPLSQTSDLSYRFNNISIGGPCSQATYQTNLCYQQSHCAAGFVSQQYPAYYTDTSANVQVSTRPQRRESSGDLYRTVLVANAQPHLQVQQSPQPQPVLRSQVAHQQQTISEQSPLQLSSPQQSRPSFSARPALQAPTVPVLNYSRQSPVVGSVYQGASHFQPVLQQLNSVSNVRPSTLISGKFTRLQSTPRYSSPSAVRQFTPTQNVYTPVVSSSRHLVYDSSSLPGPSHQYNQTQVPISQPPHYVPSQATVSSFTPSTQTITLKQPNQSAQVSSFVQPSQLHLVSQLQPLAPIPEVPHPVRPTFVRSYTSTAQSAPTFVPRDPSSVPRGHFLHTGANSVTQQHMVYQSAGNMSLSASTANQNSHQDIQRETYSNHVKNPHSTMPSQHLPNSVPHANLHNPGAETQKDSISTRTPPILMHQNSCPPLSSKQQAVFEDGLFEESYSNSTPASPFNLNLEDEFPDFLLDSISDEYGENGSGSPSRANKTVSLEDIIRSYSTAASSDLTSQTYSTSPAAGGSALHVNYSPNTNQVRQMSPQTTSRPGIQAQGNAQLRSPHVPTSIHPGSVSPAVQQRQRHTSQSGVSPQMVSHRPEVALQPQVRPQQISQHSQIRSQQILPGQPGLSPQPVHSTQPTTRFPATDSLSPRESLSSSPGVSPQQAYHSQPGIPSQGYGQILVNMAAQQGVSSPGLSSNSANLQEAASPEAPRSQSPGLYSVYRSHSQESPQGSPLPQPQVQAVFKIPQGTPPMQRRNQKITHEYANSPTCALQLQDMSLNSPRPRSDTVEMGGGADEGYENQHSPDSKLQGSLSPTPNQQPVLSTSPTISTPPQRLRSGTIEMSDNSLPASSYNLAAPSNVERRSRAGTIEMVDAVGDSTLGSNYHSSSIEQRGRSGTVEMSDEYSQSKAPPYVSPAARGMPPPQYHQVSPQQSSPNTGPPPQYVMPPTPPRSAEPSPQVYASSPPQAPPQAGRVPQQQLPPGYPGMPAASSKPLPPGMQMPPNNMTAYQKQMIMQQQILAQQQQQQRFMQPRPPMLNRQVDPAVVQSMQNQRFIQQQQQQYIQQMNQNRLMQQQQQRMLMQQQVAEQQYKQQLKVEQEIAQEFLEEQILRGGSNGASLGTELDNIHTTDLVGYDPQGLAKGDVKKSPANAAVNFQKAVPVRPNQQLYSAPPRQTYQPNMAGQVPRPPGQDPIIIMPGASGFSNPGQFLSSTNISLPEKEDYASTIPNLLEQVQSKQETPFQRLRKIAEDISSCVDDVVKFKGKKGDHEFKYLEDTLQRQILLLEKVPATSSDLRSARKALVKEVQELLEILERRSS